MQDEENIDHLRYLYDNSGYVRYHNISRHFRRCVRTQGRFGTCHDDYACVDFFHGWYVDIFNLPVSNSTGCHICSIINVMKIYPNYIIEVT